LNYVCYELGNKYAVIIFPFQVAFVFDGMKRRAVSGTSEPVADVFMFLY